MTRRITWMLLSAFLIIPILAGCESRKLKEENAALKQQVDSLTQDRNSLQAKTVELERTRTDASTRVDMLTKENEELKKHLAVSIKSKGKKAAKPTAKAPAKTKAKR